MEERPDLDDPARAIFSNVATGWKHLTWSSWSLRASESDTRVTHTHTHACTEGAESSTTTYPDATAENEAQERASQTLYTRKVSQDEHVPREEKMQQAHTTPTTRPRCSFPIHVSTSLVMQYKYAYSDIQGVWQMHTQIETNYMELPDRVVLP
jgi:hypothetical protein